MNIVTEDGLPYYVASLAHHFGRDRVWWEWVRRWTSEEQRHSIVLRDYVCVTRCVDIDALEALRASCLRVGANAEPRSAKDILVYVTLQELATRAAYLATAERLDEDGRRIARRVALDENLHHLFYRDLVAEAFDVAPSTMAESTARVLCTFSMPGSRMPRFREHSRALAAEGIFGTRRLLDDVFAPVLRQWRFFERDDLNPAGEQARERVADLIGRLDAVADRFDRLSAVAPDGGGAPAADW